MKRRVFIRIRHLVLPFEVLHLLFSSFVDLNKPLFWHYFYMYYVKAELNDFLKVLSSLKFYKSVKVK